MTGCRIESGRARRTPLAVLVAATVTWMSSLHPASAYECDQFTNRLAEIADSAPLINARFQEAIEKVATAWRGEPDPRRFATLIYKELGSRHWVDPVERWAMKDPRFERLPQDPSQTIYANLPVWAGRVVYFSGIGPSIRVGDSLIGTDKLGHFVSQGWKYHRRHLRGLDEEQVVVLGVRNESTIFGAMFTGVFSNADLVANYEGYLFYRSLFEDDTIDGLPAIVVFSDGRAKVQRPFDLRHHVNDYWDEALNPNHYAPRVEKHLRRRLILLCENYETSPTAFVPRQQKLLRARYKLLRLRPMEHLRLDQLCEMEKAATDQGEDEKDGSQAQATPKERPLAAGNLSSAALR